MVAGKQAIGRSRGGLTTKIHMVTASDRVVLTFSVSGGEKNDSPEGIKLLNFTPYFKENYKLRNVIERFFRRLKRFRRISTRYDKLGILFSMIVDSLM